MDHDETGCQAPPEGPILDETGCQAPPEGPILCVNHCGFFGSSATMNMCSKCHKDMMLKQEQVKLAPSSIGKFINESSNSNANEPVVTAVAVNVDVQTNVPESKIVPVQPKEGPNRCHACRKRVGLTGFSCRCGDLFCSSHRYSDKHGCTFDYHGAAQNAIAEANPVIKPKKLDKI